MINLSKPQKLIYDMEKFSGGAIAVICGCMLTSRKTDITEVKHAINEIYRLNDALRIRIFEHGGIISQEIAEYCEQDVDVLHFENKSELNAYGEAIAKTPIDLSGSLCDMKIAILPDQYGVIIKLHHLVGDAWTVSLICNQLSALLSGEIPEAYSYKDYIAAEQTYISSKRYEKDKAFFLEQFKKCDEATYLSEKQSKTFTSERATYMIDREKTAIINEYARQNNASPFLLFITALSIYMNRIKMNAEKFYVGTAVLNRSNFCEKNTAGMFVNTVPVLIELDNQKGFVSNLENISVSMLSVLRHQKFNYDDVLSAIRSEYDFSEKLYDVMLSYQNASVNGTDIKTAWYHCGAQSESLQIHIDDRDNESIFRVHYDYLAEKFTKHEIDILHEHICNLLFDAINNDNKMLYDLEMLSSDEKQKLFHDYNDTAVDYPRNKCVHELFEEQVERIPDNAAVVACDNTLTYRELNEQANRIAHSLIEKGVEVGDIVAFALPRKSYLISTIYGILKAGAAFLPIDIDYPHDRIEYILQDSNAKLFVTEDMIGSLLDNENSSNPCIETNSEKICYCIFTSGSTGKPKGVMITHKNLVNFSDYNKYSKNQQCYMLKSCSSVFSMSSLTFDISVYENLFTLSNGLKLVFANDDEISSSEMLSKLIIKHKVDVIHSTPTKLAAFINIDTKQNSLRNIKVFMIGAENFSKEIYRKIKLCSPQAVVFNGYGPSEATIGCTFCLIDDKNSINIGKPIANAQIYIVDKYLNPTPIGVIGELCIAGDGVGAGYLNRPELTAEKFIDNPFGKGKLYKTGDLAYWREDGNIVYVGRNDFQVKIRGLRIELGEIENAIQGVDGISQSVVVVRKNSEGRQLICAFYTGNEIEIKEIRGQIGKKLPKYMLPHIFTHLEKMPLTSSGKINRKMLPEIDLNNVDTETEYIAPATENEKALSYAVQEVLGVDKVGTADNFFDLGGDSLKAIELISVLEGQGYHTDTKAIFDCDTIGELAKSLTDFAENETPFEFDGDIPATDAQMRVYTAQSMQDGTTTYNVPYIFETSEPVDLHRLQNAVDLLVDRYEILRTHFENKDETIIQVIDDNAVCKVEQLINGDYSAFVHPFDLTKTPLIRVGVYENTVMVDMHHIITDGSSMPIFMSELNELYMGRTGNKSPVQYKQFAVEKQDHTESEKYWLSVFGDEVPVLEMNTDFKRGQRQSFNGSAVYDTIDIELHNEIVNFCKEKNITPFVYYMAAFDILLSKFSGSEDIVVGMPISGRSAKYLNTIGMFVNTVALRNKPIGSKSVTEFLNEVKENSVQAINHQNYPYGELVKKLGIQSGGRNPLFDVMFAYQNEMTSEVVFGDQKLTLLPIPITTSKYDLTFNIIPRANDVVIVAEYCTDLYKESTVQRLINAYRRILGQMLSVEILKSISVITDEEKRKLLYDFNDTAVEYAKDKCVHELISEQAAKTPDKIALVFENEHFTYKQLDEMSNSLAHCLRQKGIKPNDVVLIIAKRDWRIIVAMLGILKAGGAYMPVDPSYPVERIEYMLETANSRIALSYGYSNKLNIETIDLTDFDYTTNTQNIENANSSSDLCYIIFTSGSTGKPKGVALRHSNVTNYCDNNNNNNVCHKIIKSGYESIVSVTNIVFDIFVTESLLPLVNGLTIYFANDEQVFSQQKLSELFSNSKIDVMQTTPTKMRSYIFDKNNVAYLSRLKAIILGGEALPADLYEELKKYTSAEIFNIYGPAETTVWSTNKLIESTDITIGKPIANTQVYILDHDRKPLPIGVAGELCISGDGVGAGYLNRPELTAEKFIPNPFVEGKIMYCTGDLARWREDGEIEYLGRIDTQVKIRGLRIELGEIESVMSTFAGIQLAAVTDKRDENGRQYLVGYYTTDTEIDEKALRAHLAAKLPKYMIPNYLMRLDKMPMTASGKTDRKNLPVPQMTASTVEFVAPQNELESALHRIVTEILETDRIGVTDDFFDFGGDSLRAIEYVAKAHNEGVEFTLQSVFDYPTIRELCGFIDNGEARKVVYSAEDFAKFNEILSGNVIDESFAPVKRSLGNVLLTGATGFLGAHILDSLMKSENGKIYCLVRSQKQDDRRGRLFEILNYYFGNTYDNEIGKRIIPIIGDVEQIGLSDNIPYDVQTVIHTAATVKHYGSYDYFRNVNVLGTENVIAYAQMCKARLIHISTISVSGNSMADEIEVYRSANEKSFDETSLYIGQPLENVYIHSKFEAEIAVLNLVLNGLDAKIVRVGNLTNRQSDFKFQPNYRENAFLTRVKAGLELGLFPDYLLPLYSEFSPIDATADGVVKIAQYADKQNVFHLNSNKPIYFDKLLEVLHELNIRMETVSGREFNDTLQKLAKADNTEYIYEAFQNDMDENGQLVYDSNIRIKNEFTVWFMKKVGFEWKQIDFDYIKGYIEYFRDLGYLEV